MYPTSHRPMGPGNLTRYVSAPGSLITSVVDSVIGMDEEFSTVGSESLMTRYFSADSSSLTSESSCKANGSPDLKEVYRNERVGGTNLERSYGLNQVAVEDLATATNLRGNGSSPLIRHSSSPAGFFNHLMVDSGFNVTRGVGSYSTQAGTTGHGIANGRLKSQLSFTRQDYLSQISEISESAGGGGSSSDDGPGNAGQSYGTGSFSMGTWEDTNTIMFSNPPSKRIKNINGDIVNALNGLESQFSLPTTSMEMATVEKLLQIQKDSVPCKTRAKRGFATHPRSIAERERRTRISGKLRKLQELFPNMDKQTSTSDMLDMALQHIKELQGEVQKLKKDLENCTCGCKQAT